MMQCTEHNNVPTDVILSLLKFDVQIKAFKLWTLNSMMKDFLKIMIIIKCA